MYTYMYTKGRIRCCKYKCINISGGGWGGGNYSNPYFTALICSQLANPILVPFCSLVRPWTVNNYSIHTRIKHTIACIIHVPYPREREPTTECRPTPHFGLNFLMRPCVAALESAAQMHAWNGWTVLRIIYVRSISNMLNSRKTKPS